MRKKLLSYILFSVLLSSVAFAQMQNPFGADSSSVVDSVAVQDSAMVADSLVNANDDIDAVIYASADDSLSFGVLSKRMYLYGNGLVKYKKSELKSGKIITNFETNEMEAFGVADTSDSTGNSFTQTPLLTEAGETYEGARLRYNFKTQQGFISVAKNKATDKSYGGDKVKKVNENTYFIEDGIFTTCDADTPHTHFSAKRMKVIQGDKIFAEWIFMYIAGVPLPLPIPFGVFPNESGRRSGFILPVYGSTNDQGQFFRDFGYYFALSDYFDLTLQADYYTKGGYGIHSNFRYKNRYNYSGYLDASYNKSVFQSNFYPDLSISKNWKFAWRHNQKFNPTTTLDVNLNFSSSEYDKYNSLDYSNGLNNTIQSSATFRKTWEGLGSMTLSYNRLQEIQNDRISETLPSFAFNALRFYPFRSDNYNSAKQAWYETIGVSYNNKFQNERETRNGNTDVTYGMIHNLSVNASPKVGYFNISPSLNYTEKWLPGYRSQQFESDSLVTRDHDKLSFVRTFSFSLSTSTKLYGTAQPQMLGIEALRHTLTPSLSYSYTPDFSEPMWGYYGEYIDTTGNLVRYDKYGDELSSTPRGESQSIGLSLSNLWEMKTAKDPTDTSSTQEKVQLLKANGNISYNMAADSLNLSDLSISYSTKIGSKVNLSSNSRYTFYDYTDGRRVNKYLASEGKGLFRLTNLSFSLSTRFSGDTDTDEKRTGVDSTKSDWEVEEEERTDLYYGNRRINPNFSIPWDLSMDIRYSFNKPTPDESTRSLDMGASLSFNLTKNWKISARGSYDFEDKKLLVQRVNVYRDLHCWELSFNWVPMGTYRSYFFEIRMKAPELQDIKMTKENSFYSGL